jgi:uncharacterized protein YyaL (SSP411 family)
MQKVISFFSIFILSALLVSFSHAKKEKIKWLTLTEAQNAYKANPKPIIIDVYTSWCGWCKVMDKDTYSKKEVIKYVNNNYYAVRFDAEQAAEINWGNKTYNFNTTYKANDFAVYLLSGQMGYPSTVLLSSPTAQPAPLAGYLKASELEPALKFFGDGHYKNQDFPTFMKGFTNKW